MAETTDKNPQGDKPTEAVELRAPSRMATTVISLTALAILGAATANVLPSFDLPMPSFDRFSLPKFDLAMPKLDQLPWPNFNRNAAPKSNRIAAQPQPRPAPVLVPDPYVHASLRGIQSSQQQHTEVLASLTQSSESQQGDLRRISRQLYALTAQVNALQGTAGPLTTGSIPHPKARARVLRAARKMDPKPDPAIPKPVGPVSIGGAPLVPPPSGSGA